MQGYFIYYTIDGNIIPFVPEAQQMKRLLTAHALAEATILPVFISYSFTASIMLISCHKPVR